MKTCPSCYRKHPDEVEFCDCGTDLRSVAQMASSPAPSPGGVYGKRGPWMYEFVLPLCRILVMLGAIGSTGYGVLAFLKGMFGNHQRGFGESLVVLLFYLVIAVLLAGLNCVFYVVQDYLEERC
ncbi:hypothetical protein KQI84_03405 [bacterium]|nr:hypothetical protein [bacterium]